MDMVEKALRIGLFCQNHQRSKTFSHMMEEQKV
jgi:hypothetical protein